VARYWIPDIVRYPERICFSTGAPIDGVQRRLAVSATTSADKTLEEFYYLVMGIQYPNIFAIARERECVYFAYDVAARS